jgi:hypothetical protein
MTDAREMIRGQIESLQEELRAIPPHRFKGSEDRRPPARLGVVPGPA